MSGPDTALQARAVATNTARRNGLLLAVIVTGTLLGIIWSYARLSDGRRTAVEAAEDLGACRDLAARVNALRGRPQVAEGHRLGETDLHGRIAAAATMAAVPEGAVERIESEPSRPFGETPYREDATRVHLRHVTLRELFTFLHALAGGPGGAVGAGAAGDSSAAASAGSGLRLKSIRLSAPRGEETGDRWTVEATLTYLVYDPRPAAGGATPVASLP